MTPRESELTIYKAAALAGELAPAIDAAGAELALDLSGTTELDCAGLQVLLAVARETRRQGKRFRVVDASPVVLGVLDTLGLDVELGGQR